MSTSSPTYPAVVSLLRSAGCVFAEDEAALIFDTASGPAEVEAFVARRTAGVPLEHVLGWAAFCGLRIAVEPDVFVPRQRTEFLVRLAVGLARPGDVVLDLCCGSGAVGAAVAASVGQITLVATDIHPAAVRCARRNIAGGSVHLGDLYEPLPAALRGRVDVLVANAPYVPTEDIGLMPPEARLHEPMVALDGGADGLDVQRRVAAGALDWLSPGGRLLVETSRRQAEHTAAVFAAFGMSALIRRSDELSATVVLGTRP